MNQDKECHSCEFKITGLGCIISGKRVTDHETCDDWKPRNNTLYAEDLDAIEKYREHDYILDIEKVSA